MINPFVVPFALGFAVFLCLALYFIKGRGWFKILAIATFLFISSGVYYSFDSYKGWPVIIQGDEKGSLVIHQIVITETPDGQDGSIYILTTKCDQRDVKTCMREVSKEIKQDNWLVAWSPYKVFGYEPLKVNTPKLMEIPFNQETREAMQQAKEAMENGEMASIEMENLQTTIVDGQESDSEYEGDASGTMTQGSNSMYPSAATMKRMAEQFYAETQGNDEGTPDAFEAEGKKYKLKFYAPPPPPRKVVSGQ